MLRSGSGCKSAEPVFSSYPPHDLRIPPPQKLPHSFLEKDAARGKPGVVPDRLVHPHRLIQSTRVALEHGWVDNYGAVHGHQEYQWLDMQVSKGSLLRALRLLDALQGAPPPRGVGVSRNHLRGVDLHPPLSPSPHLHGLPIAIDRSGNRMLEEWLPLHAILCGDAVAASGFQDLHHGAGRASGGGAARKDIEVSLERVGGLAVPAYVPYYPVGSFRPRDAIP